MNDSKKTLSKILLSALFLIFSNLGIAQTATISVAPVVVLMLNDSDYSCRFSIENFSPVINTTVARDQQVTATINYKLQNVPKGVNVKLTALLNSSASDLFEGLQTSSLSLNTDSNLSVLDFETSQRNSSGQIFFERTHSSAFQELYGDIILFATFSRIATEEDLVSIPEVTPGVSTITIGSGSIPCENTVFTEVNWLFDGIISD